MPPYMSPGSVSSDWDSGRLLAPPENCLPAPETLIQWLHDHRQELISEWVGRVSVQSAFYRQRPLEELTETITEGFEANLEVLTSCRFGRTEKYIDFLAPLRLAGGFPLLDVQRALEVFRSIVVRRLAAQGLQELLLNRSSRSMPVLRT